MKQQIAALTAAVLLAASLTACGKPKGPIAAGVAPSSTSSESSAELELTDTLRWINGTYAILTTANNWNLDYFGGLKPTDLGSKQMQLMLENSWDVVDRVTAKQNLDWLLTEGHRTSFLVDLESSGLAAATTEAEFQAIAAEYDDDSQVLLRLIYDSYQKFGEHAIDAWDYSRAVQCLSSYYVAGYYTKEEALDEALAICISIQQMYDSWDDFCQSYMYGYQYWSEDDIADPTSGSYKRWQAYEEVKALSNSPYDLPWDTQLVKTW